ncbi:oligosaccharide flippase family protein [Burkholderia pyrrocinia]|uniref:oligosaccharide flippase family protein n=1 Tax=Burkholderia pyrrocinia TaxID=60550 RepID=UPI0015777250|nr:oligosaccharide flippase family protein [Burkholderia pyrrocinia]NTX29345.1 oligosaccharide flippase family protein [Burkholderia pyrrocinia]QVN23294.1 oligosaccharide flippase family protein [Burkholderia pyrrocinia]
MKPSTEPAIRDIAPLAASDRASPGGERLGARTVRSLAWALVQAWGGKLVTLVTYLLVARWLGPADVGLAAAVTLSLSLVLMIAEGGLGDALVQRASLDDDDLEWPFACSIGMAVVLAAALFVLAGRVETWLGVPGLAPYLRVACAFVPIGSASAFQEGLYKRRLDFRTLAMRQLVSVSVAGAVAVALAIAGAGAWSLIAQAATFMTMSALWLWRRPVWRPRGRRNATTFWPIARFGGHVVASRLIDWCATRAVDLIVVALYGAAGLGIYAIGARLYQTALELLCRAATDVALAVLSRVAHDAGKMAATYLDVTGLAAMAAAPLFVLMAVLSHDVTIVLFGARWADSAAIMTPLMGLGAIQTVQFVNGAFLSARGRPNVTMWLTVVKLVLVLGAMACLPSHDVAGLAWLYVGAVLFITPLSFGAVVVELSVDPGRLLGRLVPPYLIALGCALIVSRLGAHLGGVSVLVRLPLLIVCFGAAYVGATWMLRRQAARQTVSMLIALRDARKGT